MNDLNLKERLMNDFKEALKAHDEVRKETISFARAAIRQVEIDQKTELGDAEIVPILAKQVKMRKDALADFKKAGRDDLVASYQAEIDVLSEYLPEPLSEEEIRRTVDDTAAEIGVEAGSGKKSMGRLMGAVMPKVKGRADGSTVRSIIETYLG
ncbi:MAG: GatB/YqeY domain-containing protein [Anaerovoracaceae bacterium]